MLSRIFLQELCDGSGHSRRHLGPTATEATGHHDVPQDGVMADWGQRLGRGQEVTYWTAIVVVVVVVHGVTSRHYGVVKPGN